MFGAFCMLSPLIYCRSLLPLVTSAAKLGNPKQCKHAIRCINIICKNKEAIYGQIFEVTTY